MITAHEAAKTRDAAGANPPLRLLVVVSNLIEYVAKMGHTAAVLDLASEMKDESEEQKQINLWGIQEELRLRGFQAYLGDNLLFVSWRNHGIDTEESTSQG